MKKHRIGIVGAGSISAQMHIPVLLNMPNVSIEWITDINGDQAKKVGSSFRLKVVGLQKPELLPECDVALLAIPTKVRTSYYQEFAQRLAAVFAEKPFALNLEDHKRFQALYPAFGIGCGYVRRMYGSNCLLKRIIEEGWFGDPVAIRISEGGRTTATGVDKPYIDDPSVSGGGILRELGCHTLDTALFVTNAAGFEILEKKFVMDGATDRKIEAKIELWCGSANRKCLLDYSVSWLDRQKNTIEVVFPAVSVSAALSPSKHLSIRGMDSKGKTAQMYDSSGHAETIYQAFFLEWSVFLWGIEHETPSVIAAKESMLATSMIDQLYNIRR